MRNRVYIKFTSESDEIEGFYELIAQTRVDSLPGEIFGFPSGDLHILKDKGINYTEASPEEVAESYEQLRTGWNEEFSQPAKKEGDTQEEKIVEKPKSILKRFLEKVS